MSVDRCGKKEKCNYSQNKHHTTDVDDHLKVCRERFANWQKKKQSDINTQEKKVG